LKGAESNGRHSVSVIEIHVLRHVAIFVQQASKKHDRFYAMQAVSTQRSQRTTKAPIGHTPEQHAWAYCAVT